MAQCQNLHFWKLVYEPAACAHHSPAPTHTPLTDVEHLHRTISRPFPDYRIIHTIIINLSTGSHLKRAVNVYLWKSPRL